MGTLRGTVVSDTDVLTKTFNDQRKSVDTTVMRQFQVEADSLEDALDTVGLPAIGSLFGATNSRLRSLTPRAVKNASNHFIIEGAYDSAVPETAEDDADTPPEDREPEWMWLSETEEEALDRDPITAQPIANAVGEPFLLTTLRPLAILHITRYQRSFDHAWIKDFVGTTNVNPFWGFVQGSALLQAIQDRPVDIDGRRLRQVESTIKFKTGWVIDENDQSVENTWRAVILHDGTKHYQDDSPSKFLPFVTPDPPEDGVPQVPTTGNLTLLGDPNLPPNPPVYIGRNRFIQTDYPATMGINYPPEPMPGG